MRKGFFGFVVTILLLTQCAEITLVVPPDLDEQKRVDLQLIEDYLTENEIFDYDTTEAGGRYFIKTIGEGDTIRQNDLIEVDFISSNLDGIILNTSFQEIADSAVSVPQGQVFGPRQMTFTQSGWTFQFVTFIAELQGNSLSEAMGISFNNMPSGTVIEVLLPSDQAFGAQETVWLMPYSVVKYEVYLTGKL